MAAAQRTPARDRGAAPRHPDALGDAALLLDGAGRIVAVSTLATARLRAQQLRGTRIEELLGDDASLLRRGLARGPTAGRLSLPGAATPRELQRLESALEETERRIHWLQSAGGGARQMAAVDLAALVGEVLGAVPAWRVRLRPQLAPARAWIDPARVRTAVRDVLRAAAEALPAGGEVIVRVGVRSGAAVLELGAAAASGAVGEAAALARAPLATEGGKVEIDAAPGRGGVCRTSLPAAAGG